MLLISWIYVHVSHARILLFPSGPRKLITEQIVGARDSNGRGVIAPRAQAHVTAASLSHVS